MNKTLAEAEAYAASIAEAKLPDAELFVIPPHTAIATVARRLSGSGVLVGGQDGYWEDEGAFTGAVSAALIKDAGAEILEIGHSERRQHFGETDATVNLKVKAALRHHLVPLICIGDTREERDAGAAAETVIRQARLALSNVSPEDVAQCLLAYEPVWAIGSSGTPASTEVVAHVHSALHRALRESPPAGVLYGGSVSLQNAAELAALEEVDGLFVGRAGWQPESFLELASAAARSRQTIRRH
jgi:triosephosphate isomerase